MGRFERKIKQRMQRDVEDFDVWFAKNREKLGNFAAQSDEEEESENGVKKLKKKAKWLIPLAFVLLAVCVTLCFLPVMRGGQAPGSQPALTFGDEAVYNAEMTDEQIREVQAAKPVLSDFYIASGDSVWLIKDDSLVFQRLDAELELTDYYLVTIQIEYNQYYNFIAKYMYEELETETSSGGYQIRYSQVGTDDSGLYLYRMRTEKDGQTIYWEIHCFEESIGQFIEQVFAG